MSKKKNQSKVPESKWRDNEYLRLYRKAERRKKKLDVIRDEKKKGYKKQSSELYKEITSINKQLRNLSRSKGYKLRKRERVRVLREVKDISKGTISYTAKVWDFQNKLASFISEKAFKKIYIVNDGKVFYTNKHRASTILYWYDQARNDAYFKVNASTPFVDVIEDYSEDKLTLHILS